MDTDRDTESALSDAETQAVHQMELGIEEVRRAHGQLVAFHHSTGRAMNHFAEAETRLRDAGYDELADEIRDDVLPRGVIQTPANRDYWTYELLERYERDFVEDILDVGDAVSEIVADGLRHPVERSLEEEWTSRAGGE